MMLCDKRRLTNEMEIQDELLLQYEAILEEMRSGPTEERMDYIHRASSVLQRLSRQTRETARNLRQTNLHAGALFVPTT